MAEEDNERQADALRKMAGEGDPPPTPPAPPRSAALFRQARPPQPGMEADPSDRERPRVPRPDRPTGPSATPAPSANDPAQRLRTVTSAESDNVQIYVPRPGDDSSASEAASSDAREAVRALNHKRTFIPILLTCGVLVLGTGASRWILSEDSAFRLFNTAVSAAMVVIGALLLVVAVLNMLQVRDALAGSGPPRPR